MKEKLLARELQEKHTEFLNRVNKHIKEVKLFTKKIEQLRADKKAAQ